ncbi:alpha/beta fold hydrolase [Bradyrhizobium sp.]|jgi:pimeloyl-ACP methyl ester carboxylesterase|uniref:alpha/beta fold hydrolase n=1 Tax=Bradyrhizobium sp. TaxID=376 RepID=UPI003C2689B6
MTNISAPLSAAASPIALAGASDMAAPAKTIVLVHGAFADGSGWKPVADILIKDGYKVAIVQQPMTSLEDDVAATGRILDRQDGSVVLVAHSYGGAVITEAGNHPKVTALVYVAAFAPDTGEVLGGLLEKTPSASTGIAPSKDGFLFLDPAVYAADFAGDLPKAEGEFLALSQMPVAAKAFGTAISQQPAWKVKPTFAIVSTQDRMINPDLERSMYKRAKAHVTEIKASHAVFLSQPRAVANVIVEAARYTS